MKLTYILSFLFPYWAIDHEELWHDFCARRAEDGLEREGPCEAVYHLY